MKRHGRRIRIAGAGLLALAFIFFFVWRFWIKPENIFPSAPRKEEIVRYRHPLTGMPLQAPSDLPFVYGVMIDQSVESWPQSGADKAFLVIEAPVEANIPRWLAFFYDGQEVEKIGPVRSARPYFIDWNNGLDGLYAHVGGSDAALKRIASDGTYDLNQFWNDAYFWRSKNRVAPHNVYISTSLLKNALARAQETKRVQRPVYGAWTFKNDSPSGQSFGCIVRYASDVYAVRWTYDARTNAYTRGGLSGESPLLKIAAKNIAVIETSIRILDDVGRREIKTVGEGNAMVFQDGRVISAVWKKPSVSERLQFFNEAGDEVEMNAGTTWIEVVGSLNQISVVP